MQQILKLQKEVEKYNETQMGLRPKEGHLKKIQENGKASKIEVESKRAINNRVLLITRSSIKEGELKHRNHLTESKGW